MNLDHFIITHFCLLNEIVPMTIKDHWLRVRGDAPKFSESKVITTKVVGTYLGLSQDKQLFVSFRHHYMHFFPALSGLHRTTLAQQATTLWAIKRKQITNSILFAASPFRFFSSRDSIALHLPVNLFHYGEMAPASILCLFGNLMCIMNNSVLISPTQKAFRGRNSLGKAQNIVFFIETLNAVLYHLFTLLVLSEEGKSSS